MADYRLYPQQLSKRKPSIPCSSSYFMLTCFDRVVACWDDVSRINYESVLRSRLKILRNSQEQCVRLQNDPDQLRSSTPPERFNENLRTAATLIEMSPGSHVDRLASCTHALLCTKFRCYMTSACWRCLENHHKTLHQQSNTQVMYTRFPATGYHSGITLNHFVINTTLHRLQEVEDVQ